MPRRKPAVVVEVPAASTQAPEPTPQVTPEVSPVAETQGSSKGPRVERVGRMIIKHF